MGRSPPPGPVAPPKTGSGYGRLLALAGGAAVTGGSVLALAASGVLPAEAGLLLGGGSAAIATPWLRSAHRARHPLGAVASPRPPVPARPPPIPRTRANRSAPRLPRSPAVLTAARPDAPHPSLFTPVSGPGQPLWSSWLPADTAALGAELVGPVPETAFRSIAQAVGPPRDGAAAFQIDLATELEPPEDDSGLEVETRLLAERSTLTWLEREALNGVPPHLRRAGPPPSDDPRVSTVPGPTLGRAPHPPQPVPAQPHGPAAPLRIPGAEPAVGPSARREPSIGAIWAPPRLSEHGGHHACPCRGSPVGRSAIPLGLPTPSPALR